MQRNATPGRLALSALSISISAALYGCGGGGGGNDNSQPAPPGPPAPPPTQPGDVVSLTNANRLITFDRATRAVRTGFAITGLQAGENILGVDIRAGGTPAGEVYALGSSGRIYTLNTATGAATLKSTLAADAADTTNPFAALDGTEFGVDFNPGVDRLRVVSNTGQNLRINVDSGATITDAALNTSGTALAGVSAAAYTNNFATACRTTLYLIDSATDRLLSASDPIGGLVAEVGALGVDGNGFNGFEIQTAADGTNSATAVLNVGGTPTVYTIDLTTGTATSVGAITGLNAGETLLGAAAAAPATAPAQAAGNVLGLTEGNRLITFTSSAPRNLCTSAPITGLQPGENLLGIDRRPANNVIYGLGSTGRVYSVDPATAAATQTALLVPEPTDATSPFTALEGTDFGVEFSHVTDSMRVASDTGQNIRVNVALGNVVTDTPLNPPGSTVTAIANSNSFAGAPLVTTTYVIDVANDRLMHLGRPSGNSQNGDLQAIGALGVGDVQAQTGFDIVGPDNLGFAALSLAGATTSDLYSINLTTGATTRISAIGGNERVRGLAFTDAPLVMALAVTADNRVIGVRTSSPGKLEIDVAVTGLQGGEKLISAELDASGEYLRAISDAGRHYLVDPATGAATGVETRD